MSCAINFRRASEDEEQLLRIIFAKVAAKSGSQLALETRAAPRRLRLEGKVRGWRTTFRERAFGSSDSPAAQRSALNVRRSNGGDHVCGSAGRQPKQAIEVCSSSRGHPDSSSYRAESEISPHRGGSRGNQVRAAKLRNPRRTRATTRTFRNKAGAVSERLFENACLLMAAECEAADQHSRGNG